MFLYMLFCHATVVIVALFVRCLPACCHAERLVSHLLEMPQLSPTSACLASAISPSTGSWFCPPVWLKNVMFFYVHSFARQLERVRRCEVPQAGEAESE